MTNADTVRRSYEAYAAGDRAFFERLLSDDFRFWSPYDQDLDRATYFERCWPAGARASFDLRRLHEIGDEVVATYEATRPDGSRFRNTEVFTFAGDRLAKVEVYFGWDL
jgi:ketosteroid isomerase-like protein